MEIIFEMLLPSKEGEPLFPDIKERLRRLNRIARVGCDDETVMRVAQRLYIEYKDRGELAALAW